MRSFLSMRLQLIVCRLQLQKTDMDLTEMLLFLILFASSRKEYTVLHISTCDIDVIFGNIYLALRVS